MIINDILPYATPNMSSGNASVGIDNILVDVAGGVDMFIPMFLLFVFGIIFLTGFISQKKRLGVADLPMWMTVASVGMLIMSLLLNQVVGLLNTEVLPIVIVITILSFLWLVLDRLFSR